MGSLNGYRELDAALRALAVNARRDTKKAGRAIADDVQLVARALLTERSHAPGTKTPSRRGEPPAMVTGRLAMSIRVTGPTGGNAEGYNVSRVGPTGVYGRIHELGGVTGRNYQTRLPARPYLRPAWRLVRPTVGQIVRATWTST